MEIRNIIIDGDNYSYRIRRSSKAKHIKLQITLDDGLILILPQKAALKDADKILRTKEYWIKKHLSIIENKKAEFFYFGKKIDLEIQYDIFRKNMSIRHEGRRLIISVPQQYKGNGSEFYRAWLKLRAEDYIPRRVKFFTDKFGFEHNKITIRNQKTRWGSCTSGGNLSFNAKLMASNKRVIDYVIVHELCHLKEMNHSKKFWRLVEEIMPDYNILRKKLKFNIT